MKRATPKALKARLRVTKVTYGDDQEALSQLAETLGGILRAHPMFRQDPSGRA